MTIPLLPYQAEAAGRLAAEARFGLFDEMGLGKTATAIGALDRAGAVRVVIICPAAVRQVWVGEFRKFGTLPRKIVKANTPTDLVQWRNGKADVLIMSYERATAWKAHFDDIYDCLIIDEAHYLKSPGAARTRAVLGTYCQGENGIARWAAHVWFLTGTPAPNDPIDVWSFARFTKATPLNLNAFTARYFKSKMGTFGARQTPREETVGELRDMLASVSIRRTKNDVGLKLPKIWVTTQTVDGSTAEILELLREHKGLDQAILSAVETGNIAFLDAQHIATMRRLVGEAKAPAAAALVAEELQNGLDKVVVMAAHRRALLVAREAFDQAGVKSVLLDGTTPERERMEAVRAFTEDADCRVFLGNIRAAGTGLTLTAAAEIVMLESSWTPADNAQAIMRVHRIGQARPVRARFISLADSIDELVSETVARKTAAITSLGLDFGTTVAA